jgi:uncharacterized protein
MNKFIKYQLPIFFFLAYFITWSAVIPAYIFAYNNGFKLTNEANTLNLINLLQGKLDTAFIPYFLLFIFSFGPTLAGIIVTGLFKGKAELKDLFARTIKYNLPIKWYALIILVPLLLNLASLALGYIFTGLQPIQFNFLVPLSLFLPFLLYMVIFTGLQEELGWRGYALPELQKKYTAEKASWILGIAWGLWHIPSNLAMPFLAGDLTIPFVVIMLLALTFGTVGWTIVITWFYNNTKSVFLIILLHGIMGTIQSYLVLSSSNPLAPILFAILPWALAIYLLRKYGKETLALSK